MNYTKIYDDHERLPKYFMNFLRSVSVNYFTNGNWHDRVCIELKKFNAYFIYEFGLYTITFANEENYFLFKMKWS